MIAELLAVATALQLATQPPPAPPAIPRPFKVGELATYSARYLFASGSGTMEVVGVDTVRGRSAYRFRFILAGGGFGYKLVDTLNSWVDTASFESLRFHQDQLERSKKRTHRYEIFPERGVYTDIGKAASPSPKGPLDDVSFLYFIRSTPLVVGQTMTFTNHFRPESNPVTLRVLRRERIKTPIGEFPAIVVRPIIRSKTGKGLFSENSEALVWLSDDSARIILQIKSEMPVMGTLTMQIRTYRPAAPAGVQK